jgi:hypothetical protein
MTIKQCYILDGSRGFQFYGSLNESLVGTEGYPFYEVPTELVGKEVMVENGLVIANHDLQYNKEIEYQKKSFKEFKEAIIKQIAYADAIGAIDTVVALKLALTNELSAYEARVLAITKGGS